MFIIRRAVQDDLNTITEIYNEAILTTDATFDTEPRTAGEQRRWFTNHGPRNPILVAELNRVVIGWASLSEWSPRRAYSNAAEVSLYVQEGFRRRGIGKKLLRALVKEGENAGLHTIIARITTDNRQSIRLHEKEGFEHIGVMREVGQKAGKLLDVCLMQKIYPGKQPVSSNNETPAAAT